MAEERTYGLREAAQRLGVSDRSVRRYVLSGQLPASQALGLHGQEYRIAESVLDGYVATVARVPMARVWLGSVTVPASLAKVEPSLAMALEALSTRQTLDAAALERAWGRIAELERDLATAQRRLSAPGLVARPLSWRERLSGREREQGDHSARNRAE
jgi:excisionase family DNA binding protein